MTDFTLSRAQLLELVGLQSAQLDNFARRQALPFARSQHGWTTYTLEHAVRLSLFRALTGAGIEQASAAGMVRAGYADLIEAAETSSERDGPMLFGQYVNRNEDADEITHGREDLAVRTKHLGRRLAELAERDRTQGEAFVRVVLVNASDAILSLLDRLPDAADGSAEVARLRRLFTVQTHG